jgi:peptidoglycan hydrolase CwlO-like protein
MATQPQTSNLQKLFQETIDQNIGTIATNEESIKESQVIIDYFDPSCKGLDGQIVSLNNSINTLKTEIVTLYSQAYAVGCGTTAGATVVYPDTIVDSSYNLSSASYDADDPYAITNQTLTSSNVGFGTFVIYTQNNNQVAGLGSAYGSVGSCFRPGCISGNCTNYASQITSKQNEITQLRSQISNLVSSVNSLKTERVGYQNRRWSDNHTNRNLREENQRLELGLTILSNPSYDSFI